MKYKRMPIEIESPEQLGYDTIECNLAESSMSDAIFKDLKLDLNNLILCYGDHLGKPELRELISSEHSGLSPNDILITAGAASALFIVATSLLEQKNHLIVVRPNYATNIETPRAIGCEIDYVDLDFENNFQPDLNQIKSLIKHNTKYISITNPHNPTGVCISEQTLLQLIHLAEAKNCYLLVDETYRDLSLGNKLPLAASLSANVISVSSVSKTYGLPGIRIGWIITKNKQLQELFLAAKEQIFICNSIVDEEIAYQLLKQKDVFLPLIQKKIKTNFELISSWMDQNKHMEWINPAGGVVCFPRIKQEIKVDVNLFYDVLYKKYKTLVGPGHWFEMDKRYMRIGYGWPETKMLQEGLNNISHAIKEAIV
ncbi:MAG: aminotransferase class I/II-fold pyridoxal phosphate-dependent enzyme [Bacteroidota bacterium]